MNRRRSFFTSFFTLLLCSLLVACGGGGDGSSDSPPTDPVPSSVLSGSAVKGVIKNGIVTVYGVDELGLSREEPLAFGRTSALDGSYSLTVEGYSGPVIVEVTADGDSVMVCDVLGTDSCGPGIGFGDDVALDEDFSLKAVVPSVDAGEDVSANVTLLTSMAAKLVETSGVIDSETAEEANAQVAALFEISGKLTELPVVDVTDAVGMANAGEDTKQVALISAALLSEGLESDGDISDALAMVTDSFVANGGQLIDNEQVNDPSVVTLEEVLINVMVLIESEELGDVDFGDVEAANEALLDSVRVETRDSDGDGVIDLEDAFPLDPNETHDNDNDGIGNNADTDDDNDGVEDSEDAFPFDSSETHDNDNDGIGNNTDTDDDNDGVKDTIDVFPFDHSESVDTDGDGVGDNADAYPDQSACQINNQGNGSECYVTWLPEQGIQHIAGSKGGKVFFYEQVNEQIIIFDALQSSYSSVSIPQSETDVLTQIEYSDPHGRLYMGFASGRIAYLTVADRQVVEFALTSESVYGLASVGDFLLAQDNSGAWDSHYIFDENGQQTDWVEWNYYSSYYAWNDALDRVYFFRDHTGPNDLHYEEINQSSGLITANDESPYHGDYTIKGPIRVSPNGKQVFIGAGEIYNATTLEVENSIGLSVDNALWSDATGLVVFVQSTDSFQLIRFDSDFLPVEVSTIPGTLVAAFEQEDHGLLLIENQSGYEFHQYVANDDIDGDGVPNALDSFPSDVAASVDSDRDGAPDAWNPGYTESDSTEDLVLDAFSNDSICQLPEHGLNGLCDIASRVVLNSADKTVVYDDIAYVLSAQGSQINRWDISSEEYLNPILLKSNLLFGAPTSMAVGPGDDLLVGTNAGGLYRYPKSGAGTPVLVNLFPKPVTELFVSANHYIVITGEGSYYRDYHVVEQSGEIVSSYDYGDFSRDYEFVAESQRLYWYSNSYSDYIESMVVDENTGNFTGFLTRRYSDAPTSFMSIADDEQLIVTGNRTVVENYLTSDSQFQLPASLMLTEEAELRDFVWLNETSIGLFEENGDSVLTVYSNDLKSAFTDMELEYGVSFMEPLGTDLLVLAETSSGLRFERLSIEGDADQDGLPVWWEASYGFSDENANDRLLDPDLDGLTNLEEYQAGTLPGNEDSDGDGLNDGYELSLSLNPLLPDSDGDFMPDAWEDGNGLDGTDAADAALDSDLDGVSNYHEFLSDTDPQDSDSTPAYLSDVLYSFEDGLAPLEWIIDGATAFSTSYVYDGTVSLEISGDATIDWSRLFGNTELKFYVTSDCYSSGDKRLSIEIDNDEFYSDYVQQTNWNKVQALVSEGYRDITLSIESYNDNCSLYIDAVSVKPLVSIFKMGGNIVSQKDNNLYIYSYTGEVLRQVKIPGQLDYSDYARDISVLDDGRIAVFNGTFSPVLSLYTPETNDWEHIQAPSWSTINNSSYGGIDAINDRVFATNMSVYGNSTSGIVEFNLGSNSVDYVSGAGLEDLTVGLDGYIYGVTGSQVNKYSPATLTLLDSVSINNEESYQVDVRAVAVDATGDIFSVAWDGNVYQHDSEGSFVTSLNVSNDLYDISLRSTGEIVVSDRSGQVFSTTTALSDYLQTSLQGEFVDFVPDIDSDSDGIPNWWEGGYGLDANDANDASQDMDEDGLTALEEYGLGTWENESDTDGDGLTDGDEHLSIGTEPLDPDSDDDGLSDGQENDIGSDPNEPDTDGDGLTDAEEHLTQSTDPLVADTDLDGMNDGYEVENGLDALSDDAAADLDGDSLTNLEEFNALTDPNLVDTDGDTLSDYDELTVHGTSPLLPDTDSDKLRDDWELSYGFDATDSSNALLDGDDDLFSNLEEYYAGSDPTLGSSYPQPIEWETHQGNAAHTGYTPHILSDADFQFKWETTFDNVTSLNPVAASADQAFVSSDSYYGHQAVFAVDAMIGDVQWELSFDNISSMNAPAQHDGKVYFQTGGHGDSFIRSVDADTGTLNFESSYGNQWSRYLAPTIYDGSIYMAGGYFGGVYAFDATTGTEEWFASGPQYDEFTPAVDESFVYAFTTHLDILDRTTGEVAASIDFPEFDWSGYSVDVATVLTPDKNVVATQRGTLVVFDTLSENILWQRVDAGFFGQPSVANGTVYAIANGSLYAIDEDTNENQWVVGFHDYQSNIVVTKTHIFVGDASSTYALDIATQEEVWSYPAAGHLSISSDGTLYIAGQSLVSISLQ